MGTDARRGSTAAKCRAKLHIYRLHLIKIDDGGIVRRHKKRYGELISHNGKVNSHIGISATARGEGGIYRGEEPHRTHESRDQEYWRDAAVAVVYHIEQHKKRKKRV